MKTRKTLVQNNLYIVELFCTDRGWIYVSGPMYLIDALALEGRIQGWVS